MRLSLILFAALLTPALAHAETIRLTPEQAEEAIAKGAARRRASPEQLSDLPSADRRMHGEVGVAIGTGGYRSFYGTAAVPLGDNGGIVLGYNQMRGRGYGLCHEISAEMCDWRFPAPGMDPLR